MVIRLNQSNYTVSLSVITEIYMAMFEVVEVYPFTCQMKNDITYVHRGLTNSEKVIN